jgi:hypothetical protein
MIFGLVGGAIFGALFGLLFDDNPNFIDAHDVIIGTVIFAVVGAVGGGFVGLPGG